MDLGAVIERLMTNGDIDAVRRNVRAQFGPATQELLGATFLPEREVEATEYWEDEVLYQTIIANDGSRYSPAQIKEGGEIVGSFLVTLGNSDIARHFTSRDYDKLMKLLRRADSMAAMVRILDWVDVTLNLALVNFNEKQRWDALINAQVLRRGDNNYAETIFYSNPPGHRINAAGTYSDPAYDPWPDITAAAQMMRNKGYVVNRMVTSTSVISILASNPNIAQRAGAQPLVINAAGNVVRLPNQLVSRDALNAMLTREGLPPFEVYDRTYKTQVGTVRYMPANVIFMAATTGRQEEYVVDNELILVPNTLGYTGIGPAVGQAEPGRVIHLEAFTNKPPRIEGEAWQTSLPVVLDPEAMVVIKNIE